MLRFDFCDLTELPTEIGNLIHLRYLRMHDCILRDLPKTVYDLYNLQTLYLDQCSGLSELPPGIEKLAKLRHLSFDGKFPEGIEKLTCLQTLTHISVGRGYSKFGCLKDLNQLRGSLTIDIAGDLCDATDMAECDNANLNSKIHIQALEYNFQIAEDIRVEEDLIEALKPPVNLQSLYFSYYPKPQLPIWMTTSLNNLTNLTLYICLGLTSLPPFGVLPSLERIHFFDLDNLHIVDLSFLGVRVTPNLKDVEDEDAATLTSQAIGSFLKLIELKFEFCQRWKKWEDIGPENETDDAIPLIFPRLRRLIIDFCPNLEVLPHRLLRKASSLEYIQLNREKYDHRSAVLSFLAEVEAAESAATEASPQG